MRQLADNAANHADCLQIYAFLLLKSITPAPRIISAPRIVKIRVPLPPVEGSTTPLLFQTRICQVSSA